MARKSNAAVLEVSITAPSDDRATDEIIANLVAPVTAGDPVTTADTSAAVNAALEIMSPEPVSGERAVTANGFTFVQDIGPANDSDELFLAAIKRLSKALDANDYVAAIREFVKIPGARTWYIAHQIVDGKTKTGETVKRNRRATAGLTSAILRMTFAGELKPMQFMAVTVPTRTVKGEKVFSGTRLFKRS